MDDRTLEALGLAEAPRDRPLLYPGAWPPDSGLLDGDRLLPLDRLVHEDRAPVLAVGSNACPAQLRHKTAEFGITSPIPMVRSRVTGLGVGGCWRRGPGCGSCSARHPSRSARGPAPTGGAARAAPGCSPRSGW